MVATIHVNKLDSILTQSWPNVLHSTKCLDIILHTCREAYHMTNMRLFLRAHGHDGVISQIFGCSFVLTWLMFDISCDACVPRFIAFHCLAVRVFLWLCLCRNCEPGLNCYLNLYLAATTDNNRQQANNCWQNTHNDQKRWNRRQHCVYLFMQYEKWYRSDYMSGSRTMFWKN